MRAIASTTLLFVTAIATSATAGPGCGGDPVAAVARIFDAADADQDGSLTQAEYDDAGLPGFGVSFADTDLNADGVATLEEYLRIYEQHHPPVEGREA